MSDGAPTGLFFAFLVHREESPRWGVTWLARSVLTGHTAEALSPEGAIASLQRTIDASIAFSLKLGQTAEAWYAAQKIDDPKHVAAFCRVAAEGAVQRSLDMPHLPLAASATVVGDRSAA